MPRKFRTLTKKTSGVLTPAAWDFLNDRLVDNDDDSFYKFGLIADVSHLCDDHTNRSLWTAYGPQVLALWATEQPGRRPALWWRYDCPRLSSEQGPLPLPLPRLRIGGKGNATDKWGDSFLGILNNFGLRWQDDRWKEEKGCDVDFYDPPVFESQAAFLTRHNLLTDGEEERLTEDDFAPDDLLTSLRIRQHFGSDIISWREERGANG